MLLVYFSLYLFFQVKTHTKNEHFSKSFSFIVFFLISTPETRLRVNLATHIAGELGDFGRVLKLWRLAEVDAVTFGVLQVLPVFHLWGNVPWDKLCMHFYQLGNAKGLPVRFPCGVASCTKYKVLVSTSELRHSIATVTEVWLEDGNHTILSFTMTPQLCSTCHLPSRIYSLFTCRWGCLDEWSDSF